jgi:hypothetical protein
MRWEEIRQMVILCWYISEAEPETKITNGVTNLCVGWGGGDGTWIVTG